MKFKSILVLALTLFLAMPALAWFGSKSSDQEVAKDLEHMLKDGERSVPLPAITNWNERKMVQWLYEMRDDPDFTTYSYLFVPMTGEFVLLCRSVGFGINASIQMANPSKIVKAIQGQRHIMPQAEPNGLFMPQGLAATYVMCLDEEKEEVKPVYVEPEVIVSPFPLK